MDITQHIKNGKLAVRVKPSASETAIIGYDAEREAVIISVAAQPEDNKANIALLKFLKKQLKKQVRLVSGAKSRDKVVSVD